MDTSGNGLRCMRATVVRLLKTDNLLLPISSEFGGARYQSESSSATRLNQLLGVCLTAVLLLLVSWSVVSSSKGGAASTRAPRVHHSGPPVELALLL